MSQESPRRVLVPVGDSVTLRQTVAYVVREAVDAADSTVESPSVHFVAPVTRRSRDSDPRVEVDEEAAAETLLERVRTWIREDIDAEEDEPLPFEVTTEIVGSDQYLFSPGDYAELLLEYAREHELDHLVLDPEFKPGARAQLLTPLGVELSLSGDVTHEEAPVGRRVRSRQLLARVFDLGAFATLFGLSYLFYLVVGGFSGLFDYVTGAVSAAIVSFVLSGVTFDRAIRPVRAARAMARWLLYVPYLFWEIAKANLGVAYIVLHPSLPIDPGMDRFRPAVPPGLPGTTLANSITLTPGTITVDVRDRDFLIHSLTRTARTGLFDGGLERAVRFVFFGREAARIASPRERGQGTAESDADSPDEPEDGPERDDTSAEGGTS